MAERPFELVKSGPVFGGNNLWTALGASASSVTATGEAEETFAAARKPALQREPDTGQKKAAPKKIRPELRVAFRNAWKAANEAATLMYAGAQKQDLADVVIGADNLEAALGKLWRLRAERDINWRVIINHVQGMLKQLFAQKRVEQLTADQCFHIKEIVEQHLGPATKTRDDVVEVTRLIEDAGFDPYGAISGEPSEEPHE